MSPRPFSRDGGEGFRPWKRGEDRDHRGFSRNDDRHNDGETDAEGNFRNDKVWRSRDAQRGGFGGHGGFDRRPPWKRDRDDRGGFGSRGGFDRRPPWKRDHDDRGFGDRGGFDRRPPWKRDRDDRDNFDSPPPWKRDRDDRGGFGGHGGFDRRPPWKRDRDDRGFGGRGGFDRRPPWKRDRDEEFGGRPSWRRDEDDEGRDSAEAAAEVADEADETVPAFNDTPESGAASDFPETSTPDSNDDEAAFNSAPRPRARKHDIPDGELLFGRQPVREMFRAGRRIVHKLILADGVKASEEITEIEALANERGVPVERHERETLDRWLNGANHQGVLAVCADYPYAEFDEILDTFLKKEGDALLVLLDHVVDPQNLGSLLRTCETAGVSGVVLPADRAVGVTPASVRASAGAAEHLAIARVSSLPDAILKLKEAKDESGEPVFVNVVGLEGADDSEPYTDIDYKGRTALVVGSEGLGLGALVKARCDHLAKLPMFGKVSSLNAGVAGALVIYEALRQRG